MYLCICIIYIGTNYWAKLLIGKYQAEYLLANIFISTYKTLSFHEVMDSIIQTWIYVSQNYFPNQLNPAVVMQLMSP